MTPARCARCAPAIAGWQRSRTPTSWTTRSGAGSSPSAGCRSRWAPSGTAASPATTSRSDRRAIPLDCHRCTGGSRPCGARPDRELAVAVGESYPTAGQAGDLSGAWIDRDISWLEFNRRVLHEALDERTPLLERVKFLAIFSANLDEFFMKRMSRLADPT